MARFKTEFWMLLSRNEKQRFVLGTSIILITLIDIVLIGVL